MKTTDLHVRLPEPIKKALASEAKRTGISLNAQIVIALSAWVAKEE